MPRKTTKPLVEPARRVPENTRLFLYVSAGGHCEFNGCNRDLLEHHVTNDPGTFGEMAHIYAFRKNGPRGSGKKRPADIHKIDNLILLCPACHKLIDDKVTDYSVAQLRKFKMAHERRIKELTSTPPDLRTVAVVLESNVAGQRVRISTRQMQDAVAPRYLDRDQVRIDLTTIPDTQDRRFWDAALAAIDEKVGSLYQRIFQEGPARHLSVFALAPIPILAYLGTTLSNKIPVALHQRHRVQEDWIWKQGTKSIEYETRRWRGGSSKGSVALVLSLSGTVWSGDLPKSIDRRFTIYEITLKHAKPTPTFLTHLKMLDAFRLEYQQALRDINKNHPTIKRIHVFPAVPAPIAVSLGLDLLPKRDPALFLYDYVKEKGGFAPTFEVNRR